MSTNEDKKGIVLNRMYTGSYLSTNLGHEVINMFQADNGRHYLYLNAKGNFSERGKQVGTMLLVRGINDNRVEVVGMAKNLNPVKSANCTLPRDLGRVNESVKQQQKDFLESEDHKVTYGDVPIIDIFGDKGQQSVYVSYWVDSKNFYRLKSGKRLIIEFVGKSETYSITSEKSGENESCEIVSNIKTIKLNANFASTSLHQFVVDNDSIRKLEKICNHDDNLEREEEKFWECKSEKVNLPKGFEKHEISLFDICQLQKDENKFSNALSYFMQKYPELWMKFLKEYLKNDSLGEIISVSREEDAKVDGKDNTGGRIDLFIRTENGYIIIENKIDSDIIIDSNKITQLQRYYNYVTYLKEEELNRLKKYEEKLESELNKRNDQYNRLSDVAKRKKGGRAEQWNEDIDNLKNESNKTKNELEKLESREIIGIVLHPDYNEPDKNVLKIGNSEFKNLPYSIIYNWLYDNAKDVLFNDGNFKAFYDAMKRHTFKYKSDSLYEDMKSTFFARIKEIRSNQDNNA